MTFSRLTTRLTTVSRSTFTRPATSIRPLSTTPARLMQSTQSPDPHNPKQSPASDSQEEAGIKSSRATEDPSTVQTGGSATGKPVSGENVDDGAGQSEAGGDPAKQNPNKPAGQKAEQLESQQKPLDPADK